MQILEWNWQMLLALGIRINRKASLIFNKKSPDTSVLEIFRFPICQSFQPSSEKYMIYSSLL